ncbi:uncharacterized protein LOC127796927 [Diospyros lotus]|uniref:uncharacterized protein LOC127796927 n=1 Tax=Diospyros lotus TaxID=55363 RepID=UPI00224E1CF3|nr:uncharacterized protein LOC127796927 [Diospyros lotus]
MENIKIDSPVAAGNSERQVAEEEADRSQAAARSYECAFCKRGFSNAQALGGHMNMHRKDKQQRVKLKHSSKLLHIKTTDQSNIDAIIPPPPTDSAEEKMVIISPSSEQWPPWINLEKPQQLPLFAETASPAHRNREAGKRLSSGSADEIIRARERSWILSLGWGMSPLNST